MTDKNREYGLLLTAESQYGTNYVRLSLTSREYGYAYPRGVNDSYQFERPKYLQDLALDGLGMYGFVSDYGEFDFIGHNPEFRDVYAIDGTRARCMVKTLTKLYRAIDKAKAYEPGDKLMAIAKALKLSFVVERKTNKPAGTSYSDNDWRWLTVEEGRNRYRELIEEAREKTRAANPPKVA